MRERTGMKVAALVAPVRRRIIAKRTNRKRRTALCCALGALALAAGPIAADATLFHQAFSARAVRVASSGARFTFGGVLSGKLVMSAAECGLAAPDGLVASLQFRGELVGLSSYPAPGGAHFSGPQVFSVLINDPSRSGGTWTSPFSQTSGTGASVLVQLVGAYAWLATSGKFTNDGTTGSLDVGLAPDTHALSGYHPGRGDLHITGTWSCSAKH